MIFWQNLQNKNNTDTTDHSSRKKVEDHSRLLRQQLLNGKYKTEIKISEPQSNTAEIGKGTPQWVGA